MNTTIVKSIELLYPSLSRYLSQTGGGKPSKYIMRGIRMAVFVWFSTTLMIAIILPEWWWMGIVAAFGLFSHHMIAPKIEAEKLTKTIERDLPYALRDILVQVRAGVTLYDAFKSVRHGYGAVSNLFGRMIGEIKAGKSLAYSLERLSSRCESEHLQRAVWQLQNAMKSGARMDRAIEIAVTELNRSQKDAIQKYSKELSFWTMIYLVVGLVFPSLGITFLNVMFAVMGGSISETFFFVTAIIYVLLLTFMLKSIKSKKPVSF